MTTAEKNEIIKAFAFEFSSERVAEECGITVSEAEELSEKYSEEIKTKRCEKHE